MSTWLDSVLLATEEAESPKSFIWWSAMASMAAVMRKNVWLNKFYYKLYPNIYVMLMTDSGGRKGFPVSLAKGLVIKAANTKVISGRTSIEKIIASLGTAYTKENGGAPITEAHGFIVSGEFDELLIKSEDALSIITSLYNTHEYDNANWVYDLKSGKTELKNVCVSLLGASNEALFKKAVPGYAIEGGFVGRMVVVNDDGSGKINDLTEAPKNIFDIEQLSQYLIALKDVKGEFKYSDGGKKWYQDWYKTHRSKIVKDKTGTYNRLHDQILKVAMLLSLSRGTDLIINEDDLTKSRDEVVKQAVKARFMGEYTEVSNSTVTTAIRVVFTVLRKRADHQISRMTLLKNYHQHMDANTLQTAIETLEQAGLVETEHVLGSGTTTYKLTEKAIAGVKNFETEED